MQFDATTGATLGATTTRAAWAAALRDALGSGYKIVWRTAGDVAVLTLTMSGLATVSNQQIVISSAPSSVTSAGGTPTKTRLESADGTKWAALDAMIPLVDGNKSPLSVSAGTAGFSWVYSLTINPPAGLAHMPTWLSSAELLTWGTVSSSLMTDTGSGTGIISYSGAAVAGTDLIVNGGGHNDYGGNEVIKLPLAEDAPVWTTIGAATPVGDRAADVAYYSDGKPTSRHTYWAIQYVEEHNRIFLIGGFAFGPDLPLLEVLAIDGFSLSTNSWDVQGTWPNIQDYSSGMSLAQDDFGNIWFTMGGDLYRIDTTTMQYTNLGVITGGTQVDTPMIYDPVRQRLFRTYKPFGVVGPQTLDLSGSPLSGMPAVANVVLSGPETSPAVIGRWNQMVYCGDRDSYLVMLDGDATHTVYEIDPDTWVVTVLTLAGTAPVNASDPFVGYYGRFAWIPDLHCCVLAHNANRSVKFFRTA